MIELPVLVFEYIENDPIHGALVGRQPVGDRCHGDLRRSPVREPEHTGRDTAKRHTAKPFVPAQVQRVAVAVREVPLQFRSQAVLHDGPHDVDHLLRRKVIRVGQHRDRGRLFVIRSVTGPQLVHLPGALRSQLDSGERVDAVLYSYPNHTWRQHLLRP